MRIDIAQAVKLLTSGQVVSLPTETVYGLAACLNQPGAIENIFKLKGRPLHNPLIIHVSDFNRIEDYLSFSIPVFHELATAFWPGPLTLILPIDMLKIPRLVRADLPTAAFRIPDHADTLEVIKQTGPLVMPSANLSGSPSATTANHVEKDFGLMFPVLDGGICHEGLESTILYFLDSKWVILRHGALTQEALENVLGYQPEYFVTSEQQLKPLSPGQLLRHYAPKTKLIGGDESLMQQAPCILGFRERAYPQNARVLYLGSLENAGEVASNLYHILRELDLEQASWAWVDMDIPNKGLWKTITDRLKRAMQND